MIFFSIFKLNAWKSHDFHAMSRLLHSNSVCLFLYLITASAKVVL